MTSTMVDQSDCSIEGGYICIHLLRGVYFFVGGKDVLAKLVIHGKLATKLTEWTVRVFFHQLNSTCPFKQPYNCHSSASAIVFSRFSTQLLSYTYCSQLAITVPPTKLFWLWYKQVIALGFVSKRFTLPQACGPRQCKSQRPQPRAITYTYTIGCHLHTCPLGTYTSRYQALLSFCQVATSWLLWI